MIGYGDFYFPMMIFFFNFDSDDFLFNGGDFLLVAGREVGGEERGWMKMKEMKDKNKI